MVRFKTSNLKSSLLLLLILSMAIKHCICSIACSSIFSRLYKLILLAFYWNASFHLQNFRPAFIFVGLCAVLDVLETHMRWFIRYLH